MLGKLFNLGTGGNAGPSPSAQHSSQKPVSSLESVQEDIHTRNLLFPDAQALYQHRHDQVYPLSTGSPLPATSSTNAFDYNSDLELEARDVRVIVMQDALSSVAASLLYDSQTPPPAPASAADRPSSTPGAPYFSFQEPRRTPASPRKPSLGHGQRPSAAVQPDGGPQLRQSAFDPRPPTHGRSQQPLIESEPQRAWREYREEITTFSGCIFGNSELMAYKGTSTKVHVVPSEPPRPVESSSSVIGDGKGSVGRSTFRSSRLSQSFSSESVPPFNPPSTPSAVPRPSERKKVLITRLFPVSLPADDESTPTPTSQQQQNPFSDDNGNYPFPMAGEDPARAKKKKTQPKQKRTPMYAVALVINLPTSSSQATSAAMPRSGFRGPSSYTEQESFPSSFNSARRSGWAMVGHDSFDSTFSSDMEDRMDAITQHWDIIMRTLTRLQSVAASTLFSMLRQVDLASVDPSATQSSSTAYHHHHHYPPRASSGRRRSEDGTSPVKMPKSNAKHITLLPNCLMENATIVAEAGLSRSRIVAGLRATRVITGQNRWGIWREEARWIAKWAGGREQGFFFFNLLTGFLATHTDWLQALGPPSHRKRHFLRQQKTSRGEEDASVPARTIIVAHDKMAARRLIFLLSAFLPANQHLPGTMTHRPSTSTSFGALSQSPPSFVVPILKEESLRRKINRRPGPRRTSHSRNVSLQGQSQGQGQGRASAAPGVPPTLAHLSMEGRHERRASDTASIKTTNLAVSGTDHMLRKTSSATVATITPETSIPHFSTVHRAEAALGRDRPGSSSNNTVADDLKRLTRENPAGQGSPVKGHSRQGSRWGSVISGLWNGRRRDSTAGAADATDVHGLTGPTAADATATPGSPVKKSTPPQKTPRTESQTIQQPYPEASAHHGDAVVAAQAREDPTTPRTILESSCQTTATSGRDVAAAASKAERTPDPSGAFESPVKTSINLDDGVIDVDVPFPDYLTSLETAVSSPSSSGFLSTPGLGSGLDAFEQSSRLPPDGEVPINVAGWLQHYHPDFVLQAIPHQADLVEQVKASLRAEPSPSLWTRTAHATPPSGDQATPPPAEQWVDISTAVIADTTNFSISRIRYRRLVRPKPTVDRGGSVAAAAAATTTTTTATGGSHLQNSSSTAQTPSSVYTYELPLQDEFIQEPIVALDEVLVDAVERVMAFSMDTSKSSSAASSRSTSKMRERSNSESTQSDEAARLSSTLPIPHEVPRARCKTVILSALEEIVRDVVETRDLEHLEHTDGGGSTSAATRQERESILRTAVRAWLDSTELGD